MFTCGLHKRRLENHSPTKACKHGKSDEHQFAVFVQSQRCVPLGKFFAVGKHAKQAVDEGLARCDKVWFVRSAWASAKPINVSSSSSCCSVWGCLASSIWRFPSSFLLPAFLAITVIRMVMVFVVAERMPVIGACSWHKDSHLFYNFVCVSNL